MNSPGKTASRPLDEAALLAELTAELNNLGDAGRVSRDALERELLWLTVIMSPRAPGVAWAASEAPLSRLCSLVRADADRLRRQSAVLREVAVRTRRRAERKRARTHLSVMEGGET